MENVASDYDDHLPPADLRPLQRSYGVTLSYPSRLNLADELLGPAIDSGLADRPALYYGDRVFSFRELDDRASRFAGGLRELGIEKGDRVLLRFPNRPELAVAWLALQKLGAIAVATMPLLRAREIEYIANDAGVVAAVVSSDLLEDVEKALPSVRTTRCLVVAGEPRPNAIPFAKVAESQPARSVAVRRDDPVMIAYTSGSTGVPKGCVHFAEDVLASADTYAKAILSPGPGDIFTGHPSLAFTYGLGGLLVFPLRFGAASCLIEGFHPEKMLQTISDYHATACFCAPTSYKRMLQVEGAKQRFDLSRLRLPMSAGETLPAGTFEQWRDVFGHEILDGIGGTEMFHVYIASRPGHARAGSTGEVVPGYIAKVVDAASMEMPDGQPGLLAVSGPTGCKYWRNPERQREYVRDGWNFPGDVYIRDSDGFFWYQCRSDDMIITSGHNVSGPEVENVLLEHPSVAEVAVVASPDELRTNIVKAFVVLKEGCSESADLASALQDHVRQEIAAFKCPREIEFISAIPRTETGKVRRVVLRQREIERKSSPPR